MKEKLRIFFKNGWLWVSLRVVVFLKCESVGRTDTVSVWYAYWHCVSISVHYLLNVVYDASIQCKFIRTLYFGFKRDFTFLKFFPYSYKSMPQCFQIWQVSAKYCTFLDFLHIVHKSFWKHLHARYTDTLKNCMMLPYVQCWIGKIWILTYRASRKEA